MKEKTSKVTTVTTVTGASGMPPAGPSIGYAETHTFQMNDGKGSSTKLVQDLPMKYISMDSEELPRVWDAIVKSSKPIEPVAEREALQEKLNQNDNARFDDDGSAWL